MFDSTRLPGPSARCRSEEKGDLQKEPPGGVAVEADNHGLGRSRGGLTTRLHLAIEQGQKPMSIVITLKAPCRGHEVRQLTVRYEETVLVAAVNERL